MRQLVRWYRAVKCRMTCDMTAIRVWKKGQLPKYWMMCSCKRIKFQISQTEYLRFERARKA